MNKHYFLVQDIELGANFTPIGLTADTDPNKFSGVIAGNDYVIKNGTINLTDSDFIGVFAYIDESGEIHNLGVENVHVRGYSKVGGLAGQNDGSIHNSFVTGSVAGSDYYIGGLVGLNNGTIVSSYATGNITGPEEYRNVFYTGGLVGKNNGTISDSYASGDVFSGDTGVGGLVGTDYLSTIKNYYALGDVTGTSSTIFVGGLVGDSSIGTISNSFARGNIIGNDFVGGLVGRHGSEIINSYSTGSVRALKEENPNAGGLVGHVTNTAAMKNSYYDLETSGRNDTNGNSIPKTTAEMTLGRSDENIFTVWDTNIWIIEAGDYPWL